MKVAKYLITVVVLSYLAVFSLIISAQIVKAQTLRIHTITSAPVHVVQGQERTVRIVCPAGEELSGGGYWIETGAAFIIRQMQSLTVREAWEVVAEGGPGGGDIRASAQCATMGP